LLWGSKGTDREREREREKERKRKQKKKESEENKRKKERGKGERATREPTGGINNWPQTMLAKRRTFSFSYRYLVLLSLFPP